MRFETLPRLAELLGAGDLARTGKSPLARPIGDYLASQVAREAREDLAAVRELPGFARVLRQTFRRLRRGGFEQPHDVPVRLDSGLLAEVVRLYADYRSRASGFYDDEDLQDAAATRIERRPEGVAAELGDVYVIPPGAMSAAAERLLTAIRRSVGKGHYHVVPDEPGTARSSMIMAPDPASEAREVAREIIDALDSGLGLHEIGVFHGADPAYRSLLPQAFATAGLPVNSLPGVPLSETAAGRSVLMLAELPLRNYARTEVIDWLSLAPLRERLPATGGTVAALPAPWRRMAREAGVTQGAERWQSGLNALLHDLEISLAALEPDDSRRQRDEERRERTQDLKSLIEGLIARLEPLRDAQPATGFIQAFKAIVDAYIDPGAPGFEAVAGQIDQLGTIDKVGGRFTLESFTGALRANLDATYQREGSLGSGIFIADYRQAAGLAFKHTVLCGAYEGVFPAGAPAEPLVPDHIWRELRERHPMIEDAALRTERARAQAQRAIASASERLTWSAPLQATGAGREHYPSQPMVNAARELESSIASATDLRRASSQMAWLRKPASPTAALLAGTPVDLSEVRVRSSIALRRAGERLPDEHPLVPSQALLAARRGDRFGDYDGNLIPLEGDALIPRGSVSPTSLEVYAACGFRYFLSYILRLRAPDEPEDRETMDGAERGNVIHAVLREFYAGRSIQPDQPWREEDRAALVSILDRHMEDARARGKTGLDIYAEHELRRMRADLAAFLEHDTTFRRDKGAIPTHFESDLPEVPGDVVRMRGVVDRIDLSADESQAWVIDYKTGSTSAFDAMQAQNPLADGTKLQLPAYLAAVPDVEKVTALYWFISRKGAFKQKTFEASEANMQRYRQTLAAILEGIRAGAFPAVPGDENLRFGVWENCRFCDFNRLCSRRRDDELWAKRDDHGLQGWSNVGETARRVE